MSYTEALAEFAIGCRSGGLPDDVEARVRWLVLDQLGCQIANAELPWCKQVLAGVERLHPASVGDSTIIPYGVTGFPDDVALVNSTFGAGNEIDDIHIAAQTHPGAVVVPAAMAVGESVGATTEDLAAAVAAGYEVMLRIALAAEPALGSVRHHHGPLAVGPFGAAVAAGMLMGLDSTQLTNALSIAGSYCGGVMEYTRSGGSAKRLHAGIGAQSGILAANFARAGITGPARMLEGDRGFLEAFATRDKMDLMTMALGDEFHLLDTGFKNYFAMYPIHAPVQALEFLKNKHGIVGDDVARMTVHAGKIAMANASKIVHPTDPLGGQFSLRFALATVAYRHADALRYLSDEDLRHPAINDLADRVDMVPADEHWNSQGARLEIATFSGAEYTMTVPAPLGSPRNPMSSDELRAKFVRLAEPVIGMDAAASVLSQVLSTRPTDIHDLVFNLVRGGG